MPGLRRAGEPRDVHQRGQAEMLAAAQRQQPLGDEGAVEADERHHVGDGAERDQIEQRRADRAPAASRPESPPAQFAVDRNDGHEHQPDGGEVAKPGQIIEPVGIDQRRRRRQILVGLMMIDDDDIEPEPRRFGQRLDDWSCRNRP